MRKRFKGLKAPTVLPSGTPLERGIPERWRKPGGLASKPRLTSPDSTDINKGHQSGRGQGGQSEPIPESVFSPLTLIVVSFFAFFYQLSLSLSLSPPLSTAGGTKTRRGFNLTNLRQVLNKRRGSAEEKRLQGGREWRIRRFTIKVFMHYGVFLVFQEHSKHASYTLKDDNSALKLNDLNVHVAWEAINPRRRVFAW